MFCFEDLAGEVTDFCFCSLFKKKHKVKKGRMGDFPLRLLNVSSLCELINDSFLCETVVLFGLKLGQHIVRSHTGTYCLTSRASCNYSYISAHSNLNTFTGSLLAN